MGLGLKDSEDEGDHEGEEDEDFEEDKIQFGEKEQKLLNRFEKYLHSDDEELHPDVEGETPISDKSWGKKKNIFYHTDYVDDEMGGMYVCEEVQCNLLNRYPGWYTLLVSAHSWLVHTPG